MPAKTGENPALSRNGTAPSRGEPGRLDCIDDAVLGGRAVRSDASMVSWRAHFVLREPMEDDHVAKSVPTCARRDRCCRVGVVDRGLCQFRRGRPGGQRRGDVQLVDQFGAADRIVPGHGACCQRQRHDREPADVDRVTVADGHRDALRDRRRRAGECGGQGLRLPAVPCREPRSTASISTSRPLRATTPTWWSSRT